MNRAYTVQLDLQQAATIIRADAVTLALPSFPPLIRSTTPRTNREILMRLLSYLWRKRARLAALAGFVALLRQMYRWSQSAHVVPRPPLLPHVHPAFLRSPSTGLWLYTRAWRVPPEVERGRVFLLHAYRDHLGRYEPLCQSLNDAGYSVFGVDMQGHGRSGGERGYCESARHYLLDADHWLSVTQAAESAARPAGMPDVPNFLFGHSMGSTLALQLARVQEWRRLVSPEGQIADPAPAAAAARPESIAEGDEGAAAEESSSSRVAAAASVGLESPPPTTAAVLPAQRWRIDGLLLSCPALVPDHASVSPLLQFLASALADALPKFSCTKLFDSSHLSTDAEVVRRFDSDPLVVRAQPTARWGHEMLEFMADARSGVSELPLPMLVLQGALDRVVSPQGAHYLMAHARQCEDKQLRIYHDAKHDLWLDNCRQQFTQDVISWLDQHTPSPPQVANADDDATEEKKQ